MRYAKWITVMALAFALIGGGAYAATTIAKHSIGYNKLTTGLQQRVDQPGPAGLRGATGVQGSKGEAGATGPKGERGPTGPEGTPAPVGLKGWGPLVRNEFGSPIAETGTTSTGIDALILATASGAEKAEYGTESEFTGLKIADLSSIGFTEYLTDSDASAFAANQPNIQIEVNPHVAGKTYSSLVFDPGAIEAAQVNQWSTVDAARASNGGDPLYGWYFTSGAVAEATGCGQVGGQHFCTLAEVQAAAPEAEVTFSVGLGKGRDYPFQGLISEFNVNGTEFTFGPGGTFAN